MYWNSLKKIIFEAKGKNRLLLRTVSIQIVSHCIFNCRIQVFGGDIGDLVAHHEEMS